MNKIFNLTLLLLFFFGIVNAQVRLQFIFGNNKLFLKIIFGTKRSEIELFWGGFKLFLMSNEQTPLSN